MRNHINPKDTSADTDSASTTGNSYTSPTQRCYLLELPAELRDTLYHEILTVKGPVIVTGSTARYNPLAFLQVCRQIRKEACKFYYANNTFLLNRDRKRPPEDNWKISLLKWLNSLDPENVAAIRYIGAPVDYVCRSARAKWQLKSIYSAFQSLDMGIADDVVAVRVSSPVSVCETYCCRSQTPIYEKLDPSYAERSDRILSGQCIGARSSSGGGIHWVNQRTLEVLIETEKMAT